MPLSRRAISSSWIVAVTTIAVVVTSLRFWGLRSQSLVALNAAKPVLAVLQPAAIVLLCVAFARNWRNVTRWTGHAWLIVAVLVAFAAALSVLHPYFDRPELRALGLDSDIDDEFIVAAGNALRLRNPYADALYTGNPISEGPAWVILNAVFGTQVSFALLAPVYAAVFARAVWRTASAATASLALAIAVASTGLWESSFGGDLAAAGFAMAAVPMICLRSRGRTMVVIAAALLAGAVATVRLPFVVYPTLVALLLWRADTLRAAVLMGLVGTAVAVGSHLAFWALQPDAYPPFHLVGQSVQLLRPAGLTIAIAAAAIVAGLLKGLRLADAGDLLFWQGLALFLPFSIVAIGAIASVGNSGDDWTRYLAPSVPSFAAAAAIAVARPRSAAVTGV